MKVKINQRRIAKLANIGTGTLCNYLRGVRNARPAIAIALENATGIKRDIWVFGTRDQRRKAWEQFIESQKEAA